MFIQTRYFFDPAPPLGFLKLIDLVSDPKEREPINPQYLPTWVMAHCGRLLKELQESVNREPPIPAGAPLDFVPVRKIR